MCCRPSTRWVFIRFAFWAAFLRPSFEQQEKNRAELAAMGGVAGLAARLASDTSKGLDAKATGDASLASRQAYYGANRLPEKKPASFFMLMVGRGQQKETHVATALTTVLFAVREPARSHHPLADRRGNGEQMSLQCVPQECIMLSHAQVSTVLGAAIPDQRAKNEWIEGVAIWVAVFLVSGIGELLLNVFVDTSHQWFHG